MEHKRQEYARMEAEREATGHRGGGAPNAKFSGGNQTVISRRFRNQNPEEITKPLK